MIRYEYQPSHVPPPGETVEELLDHIGMSQTELARRMGRPQKRSTRLSWAKRRLRMRQPCNWSGCWIDTDSYEGAEEAEANRFAQNELIPAGSYGRFRAQGRPSAETIKHYAAQIGIAPGIVVGRLQYDDGNYQTFNHLRQPISF